MRIQRILKNFRFKIIKNMKKIIVFDMDDTLTKSLSVADDEMIRLYEELSTKYKV